ncbi:hypothetical protein [Acinetobacter terrae]|uniref:hypothetical protein n=1 Tax=Acinetobacter terrae TaxID=2731247 RepID=UPI0013F1467C|nr:hypothetical protein [Acinetobacter terrae]
MVLSACSGVPTTLPSHPSDQAQVSHSSSASIQQEVAPCTNGFDDVNVCELLS